MRRISPRVAVLAAGLTALLCASSAADGQQRMLREGVELTNLRFVGLQSEGVDVGAALTINDVALLAATDQPRTLNYLIAGQLPVQSTRLRQLMDMGLIRQEGVGFRSQIPIVHGETAERLAELLDDAAPRIAAESRAALTQLQDRLWRHPGVPTLPVVVAWMFRDRVWDHFSGVNGYDFERSLREQQVAFPERGFWGALWYTADPVAPAFDFYEWRRDEYTIQLVWNHGDGDPFFGQPDSGVPMPEILAKLDSDGRELDDHEDFPGAYRIGLVDQDGDMQVLARRYRIDDEEGLAYLIEQTAVSATEAILRNLPVSSVAQLLNVGRETAAVIAYTELVPRLVASYYDAGILVRANDDRAEWRTTLETEEDVSGPPRRAAVVSDDGTVTSVGPPEYAAIIWRQLPSRPAIRITWW